ncbi:MAG TPA: polysaccharide biosynthesis C-terminal domain-containing protein [Solirubrobacteraceae bacterium]|nr:polysaccharide biosynthesis C-terminal domain-containing protein [Solirubrobacteraceae bacterium]
MSTPGHGPSVSAPEATAAPASERGLRGDVLLMAGAKVLVLILAGAATVIVARSLGPAGRGSLASTYALATLLAQLGTFGIASANPFFAGREPHLRGSIVGNSLWLAGVIGPAMACIGIAVKIVAPGALGDISWPELAVGMFAVPVMLSSLFLQSILLAEGRMALYNGVDVGAALLTVVLLATLLPLAGGDVLLALSLMVGPQVLALVIYISAMRRHGPVLRAPDRALARRMLGYGARAYTITLIAYLLIRVDLLLVNGIQGAQAAGQYSIAVALADALYLLPISVAVNLFARVARGDADRDVSLSVFHLVAVGYLLVCGLAALLAGPAILLLFGHAYEPATSLFLWLLPGVYCLGLLNVIAYYFAAQGMPRELIFVWIPGLAINLALDLTLLPHHGTYVASLASSVAYALVLVLHLRMYAREVGGWGPLRPTLSRTSAIVRLALRRS